MDTSGIISSVLAGLTFLGIIIALGLGIWSIRETRTLQKIQYRESILNDILNWLMNIAEGAARYNLKNVADSQQVFATAANAQLHWSIVSGELGNEYRRLRNKGLVLAGCFKNEEDPLLEEMRELLKILLNLAEMHDKYRLAFLDLPNDFTAVSSLLHEQTAKQDEAEKKLGESFKTITSKAAERKYAKVFL
jgi:hypothetical protein